MKRSGSIFINAALAAALVGACAAIALPPVTEARLSGASRLVETYRWQGAERLLTETERINPLDADIPAALGDLYEREGASAARGEPYLRKAVAAYERAMRLDRTNPAYPLAIGRIRIGVVASGGEDAAKLRAAFQFFRRAHLSDPNGFLAAYSIGYTGLSVWDLLTADEKRFVVENCAQALRLRPRYGDYIYPRAWEKTKDFNMLSRMAPASLEGQKNLYDFVVRHGLWEHRKDQAVKVEKLAKTELPELSRKEVVQKKYVIKTIKSRFGNSATKRALYDTVIEPGDWQGIADDGEHQYKDGALYWGGTAFVVKRLPKGRSIVELNMKGSPVAGVYPYVVISVDGDEISEMYVGADWKTYRYDLHGDGSPKVISVTFMNDAESPDTGEDRNVYISNGMITPVKEQA